MEVSVTFQKIIEAPIGLKLCFKIILEHVLDRNIASKFF